MNNLGLSPLRGLAVLRDVKTRRFSSFDTTGGNDDRFHIQPGETVTIAETTGAGIVTHIWVTVACRSVNYLRKVVLRAYWDGEEHPSIECPIGDFFGMGHGKTKNYASLPLQSSPEDGKAFNCYFPMPFENGMRFTVTSECEDEVFFYYYLDFERHDALQPGLGRFHAQWRREVTKGVEEGSISSEELLFMGKNTDGKGNYTIMEAKGHGHYVGCLLSVYSLRRSPEWDWYGEGDDMIFIDGEQGLVPPEREARYGDRTGPMESHPAAQGPIIEPRPESSPGANDAWPPTLHGTGTEDYFNTAWCPTQEYAAPYHGVIASGGPNWSDPVTLYRFHIEDPVVFKRDIRVTIEHGHDNRRGDELSSVAFWYQAEPHLPFPAFPKASERLPSFRRPFEVR